MQVGSYTVGFIIGFGLMLVSGFFLYLELKDFKESMKEDKRDLTIWATVEVVFSALFQTPPLIIAYAGGFLLGLLIVVLLTLWLMGVIPLS